MPCNYPVYNQQRMRQVYIAERRTNTNKDTAERREATVRRKKTGLHKKREMNVFSPLKCVLSPSCCPTK